ncbi:MAG: ABC transporter ATP-binding protein [Enhydrobacter sp.]|nr:MAG: ABC transporter ATP-binding protein [Enhydrobacter sp.]
MLLEVTDVCVTFGGVRALDALSFAVDEGEIVGLVGPNGAGKSTLVGVVSGALRADSGRVRFGGRDVTRLGPHRIAALGLARTFQTVQPFLGLTTRECAVLGATFGSADGRRTRLREAALSADEALAFVGLTPQAAMPAEQLNAAQRRLLEIARVLAARPRLILLDEVLSGLNTAELERGIELVRALRRRGIAVLLIEHIVRAIAGLADRVVVIDRGAKIAEGPVSSVLADRRALSAYFGVPRGQSVP